MSSRTSCPSCGSDRVEPCSDYQGHHVDYFYCPECRHIWSVPKGREGPINHATPLRPRPLKIADQGETMRDLFARADRAIEIHRRLGAHHVELKTEAGTLRRQATTLRRQVDALGRQACDLLKACGQVLHSDRSLRRTRGAASVRLRTIADLTAWPRRKVSAA